VLIQETGTHQKSMKEKNNKIFIVIIITVLIIGSFLYFFNISEVEARSGCCSWHGGVCTYKCPDGINIGYMCCDGTSLSTKCAPYYARCPTKITPKCPSHSIYNPSSDSCECNHGYIASGDECIDVSTYCHDKYGSYSSYNTLSKSCECDYGYKLSNDKCIKEEPKSAPQPSNKQTPQQFDDGSPSQKEPQIESKGSDLDKLKAQVSEGFLDKENKNAQDSKGESVWWWIIGIGFVTYVFYTFGKRKKELRE